MDASDIKDRLKGRLMGEGGLNMFELPKNAQDPIGAATRTSSDVKTSLHLLEGTACGGGEVCLTLEGEPV